MTTGTVTAAFSVREVTAAVRDDLDTCDLDAIVNETMRRIPPEHLEDALAQALRHIAYEVTLRPSRARTHAAKDTAAAETAAESKSSRKARPKGRNANSTRSRRRKSAREIAEARLSFYYRSVRKDVMVIDYTADDLRTAAKKLASQEANLAAKRETLGRFADYLDTHDIATVRELPVEQLAAFGEAVR